MPPIPISADVSHGRWRRRWRRQQRLQINDSKCKSAWKRSARSTITPSYVPTPPTVITSLHRHVGRKWNWYTCYKWNNLEGNLVLTILLNCFQLLFNLTLENCLSLLLFTGSGHWRRIVFLTLFFYFLGLLKEPNNIRLYLFYIWTNFW